MPWGARKNDPPRLRGRAGVARARRVLARFPVCCVCHRAPSTIADHVVNLAAGGRDDESNMHGICRRCHEAKTAREAQVGRIESKHRPREQHPGDIGGGEGDRKLGPGRRRTPPAGSIKKMYGF